MLILSAVLSAHICAVAADRAVRLRERPCVGKGRRSARRRKIIQIYEGTNQIQRLVIARALLG
jgi:alkylation response protein AidB-like acyl-CoA dehydrogenase